MVSPRNTFACIVVMILVLTMVLSYGISKIADNKSYAPGGVTVVGNDSFTELYINLAPGQVANVTITDDDGTVWSAVCEAEGGRNYTVTERVKWRET